MKHTMQLLDRWIQERKAVQAKAPEPLLRDRRLEALENALYRDQRDLRELLTKLDSLFREVRGDYGSAKYVSKEGRALIQQFRQGIPLKRSEEPHFCNRAGPMGGGCAESWHVGGNYGSHVCYNPDHHDE